jgi:hypothetical protein
MPRNTKTPFSISPFTRPETVFTTTPPVPFDSTASPEKEQEAHSMKRTRILGDCVFAINQ